VKWSRLIVVRYNVQFLALIVIHRFRTKFVGSEHVDDLTNVGLRTLNELIDYLSIKLESLPVEARITEISQTIKRVSDQSNWNSLESDRHNPRTNLIRSRSITHASQSVRAHMPYERRGERRERKAHLLNPI